ncbi:MAG: hypothetical protein ACE5HE_09725 [Phycisphaerae bacterium]
MNTARGLVFTWRLVRSLFVLGLALAVQSAQAHVMEWLPVTASGNHTIVGNEIVIEGGGQTVTLHLLVSGWDPTSVGTLLGSFQGTIDPTSYLGANASPPNPGVDLNPFGWPLTPTDGAFQAVQVCGNLDCLFDPTNPACDWDEFGNCAVTPCLDPPDPRPFCFERPDWVFAGGNYVETVTTDSLSYSWSAASTSCTSDPDAGLTKFYGGTLQLEVPVGAQGTYTINFVDDINFTLMTTCLGILITPITSIPAQISIACVTDADCDDGNDCTQNICTGGICTYPAEASGTSCGGAPVGPCDAQDTCDGAGVCQTNFAAAGTACGDPNSSECDDPDTCDGTGGCLANTLPDGTTCSDDGLACTLDECAAGACIHSPRPAGTPCGDPSDTGCDNPDTCDAFGVCRSNLEPAGAACGDPTDTECDGADTCNGNGVCLANVRPAGTACGDPTATDCDSPDTCDGLGACLTHLAPAGLPCGNQVGNQCDDPDTCDGAGVCRPNSLPAGTPCGNPGTSVCDNADICDGEGTCQANNVADGTPCTDDGNPCRGDVCLGGACTHPLEPSGTPCGDPTTTECDRADTCDGAGTCSANLEPPGAACGDPTTTDCDLADTCDGTGSCQSNILPAGVACGDPTDTDCDNPDTCDGAGVCAPNVAPAGLPCGNSVGNQCDNPDTCDGAGACNTNFVLAGTPCGNPTDSVCDNPDTCNGSGACAQNREPDGTVCTDDGNDCRDDVCIAGVCAHPNSAAGTPCGNPVGSDCDGPDTCDGSGTCLPNLLPAGAPCADQSTTACTNPDTCNGFGGCLANNAPNGTNCDDGSFCNAGATCVDGQCAGGSVVDCDDGLACTTDSCNEALQQCDNILVAGNCLINGACYADGELNPANSCEICDTLVSATMWTPRPEGTLCDDGDPCTGTGEPGIGVDTCDLAGTCSGTVDPACNDDCVNAVQVFDGSNIGNNDNRGPDDDEATCQFDSNNDVWYFYVATCTGPVVMDTRGSVFAPFNDTVLSVYDACGGTEIACDDDNGPGLLSSLAFAAVDGAVYWIRVAGYLDNSGDIVLNISTLDGCVIDGICYSPGQPNPLNDCEVCIPLLSSTTWSAAAAGSPCGDPTETDCDSPDACNGLGVCEVNHKSDQEICTDDGNDCSDDVCFGGLCTHPPKPVGTACGDPTVNECDNADTCDGAGACQPNFVPTGVACGDPSVSDCDNADICDGQGGCSPNHQPDGLACTDEGIECTFDECSAGVCVHPPRPAGTACGDGSNTQCDAPDTCDGTGGCLPNYSDTGVPCGDPTDTECDNPDTCNGTGTCIPNLEPVGVACGDPTNTDCNRPDSCDGSGVCLSNFEIAGFPCGDPSSTQCDNPDTCDGAGTCLVNVEPAGVPCGDPSSSDCDNPDICDGQGACDPNHQPDGLECPDEGVECTQDLCQTGACTHPPRIAGTPCGDGSSTQCDSPDTCDGTGACAVNFKTAGTPCGDPTDTECDNADTCDGAGACAANFEPPGFTCGDPTDNDCNNPDTCDGAGGCLDNYEVSGFPCGDPGNTQCDNPDTCNGVGTCLVNHEPEGLPCGDPASGECDNPDSCDSAGQCAANHVPDNTACTDDGNQCSNDICLGGACTHPNKPDGTPCNDADVCTANDTCSTGLCAGTLIAQQPLMVQEGPKAVSIVVQPVLPAPDVALVVSSPDWVCLNKYVGSLECGGNGRICTTDADCNQCSFTAFPCLTTTDCDHGRCTSGMDCSVSAQDCLDASTCVRDEFCVISGKSCVPAPLRPMDINADGLMDGLRATLVDDPSLATVMSLAGWTAGVTRCSESGLPCTTDVDCDRGICDNGVFCNVSEQNCLDASPCVLNEVCLPGRVFLTGPDVVPGTQYEARAECGTLLTSPGSASTCLWADVTCDGFVNVTDVQLMQLGFQGTFEFASLVQLDIDPCAPQGIINVSDIQRVVLAIQGQTYAGTGCPVPCP